MSSILAKLFSGLTIILLSSEVYAGTVYWYVDEEGITHFGPTPSGGTTSSSGEYEYEDIIERPVENYDDSSRYNERQNNRRGNDDGRQYNNDSYNDGLSGANDFSNNESYEDDYQNNNGFNQSGDDQDTVYFDNNSLGNIQDRSQVITIDKNSDSQRFEDQRRPVSRGNNNVYQDNIRNNPNVSNDNYQMPKYDERHNRRFINQQNMTEQNQIPNREMNNNSGDRPASGKNNKRNIINLSNRPYHAEDFER
ncbi:MAG: hypothetical protein K5752_09730 [Succinivibrionaceae bacterium]|jgi:hypothetical protein|nr:hypothetical protein [Succinivibrionaceae bacterium]